MPNKERTVLKKLAHVDANDAANTIQILPGLTIRTLREQNTLVLRGYPSTVDTALEILESLDVPHLSKSLALSVYILSSSQEGGQTLPDHLQGVAQELSALLGYEGFSLLDTVLLRVSDGNGSQAEGGLIQDQGRTRYRLSIASARVSPGSDHSSPATIRLRNLDFALFVPRPESTDVLAGIRTNVELEEGQTAVVGKATPAGGDGALILVVRAEILG